MSKLNLPPKPNRIEKTEITNKPRVKRKNGDINAPMESIDNQSGTEFLLSIAGMFSSEPSNTSEEVNLVVSNFVERKFGKLNGDKSN